MQRSLPNRLH